MAGHDEDQNFKGLSRYFNSQTDRGRANVSKVTMSLVALYYIYHKLSKPKGKKKKS